MFDEGWARDFKVSKVFFFSSKVFHLALSRRHFNMLHINCTDGVGGDRPNVCVAEPCNCAVARLGTWFVFESREMIGADKTENL